MSPRRRSTLRDSDELEGEQGPRATLLQSEAEELRQRLDALLDELGRHHRRDPAWPALIRRYTPALLGMVVAGTGILAYVGWRRRRRLTTGARLSARLARLVASAA